MIIFNWNQNKVSWCIIENDHNFEQNEDLVTVFLKWMDFNGSLQYYYFLNFLGVLLTETLSCLQIYVGSSLQIKKNQTKPVFLNFKWPTKGNFFSYLVTLITWLSPFSVHFFCTKKKKKNILKTQKWWSYYLNENHLNLSMTLI